MYCQACGVLLTQQMKYCNRCGAAVDKTDVEKRLDDYLDGLFWITIFGLAFVFGGMVLLKKFNFSQALIIAYMALSSVAFLVNFGLNLGRYVQLTARSSRNASSLDAAPKTSELPAADPSMVIGPTPSVTENTTRSFEPVYVKKNPE